MYSVSQAAVLLGVHPTTIRRWDQNGVIRCSRTPGGHRRIAAVEIQRIIAGKRRQYSRRKTRAVATYARVSSHEQKQKGDLTRQQEKLKQYCDQHSLPLVAELKDIASGLNTNRQGLRQLFKLVTKGKVSEVVVSYPDRLTRFGFGYLEEFFSNYDVRITVLEQKEEISMEQEMVDDLVAIVTSFSGRIHGMRSRRRKPCISDSES